MQVTDSNIVLIGFASTGKSTTGRALATQLGWDFIDLDDVVEALHIEEKGVERRCRDIFSLYGRDCFINYETKALMRLKDRTRTVIATGGGTPISERNRPLTQSLGYVVYLNAEVRAILERMSAKGYPRYLGPNPTIEDLTGLWTERHDTYTSIANLVVDNSARSPGETADLIVSHFNERNDDRTI